jgi:hypothetical protein
MRTHALVVLASLVSTAACSSGPTKSESLQIFAAATAAMASAQARAVTDARQLQALIEPADLVLDFSGACALGGSVGVSGTYNDAGTGERAAFDMTTSFDACKEALGTLDGRLRWTSVATNTSFSATMTGELDWTGSNGDSASCDFELSMAVTATSVTYSGNLCGYDVRADLGINN